MLEILSKNHDTWVSMGLSLGIPSDMVEDFVHETYLRLLKYIDNPEKIMYNETEINKFYVYVTLRNLWTDYCKEKSKYNSRKIEDFDVIYEEVDYDREIADTNLINNINEEVDSWEHWYDRKLFKLYFSSNLSLRKLADETKISVTSIFNSCRNYKNLLREKFLEDFEDYINGDFEFIKRNNKK